MFLGFLFTILTGFVWTGVVVSLSRASHSNKNMETFYVVGPVVCTVLLLLGRLCGIFHFFPESGVVFRPVLFIILGAVCCLVANFCTMYTLGCKGASALYFTLSSMGFAVSFLWSVFVWGQKMSVLNGIGLLCMIFAVALSAMGKSKGKGAITGTGVDYFRLMLALLSTVVGGFNQIFLIWPQGEASLPSMGKTLVIMLTYIVLCTGIGLYRKSLFKNCSREFYRISASWGGIAILSYACIFTAVTYLEACGRSGIAYPLGGAVQFLLFSLYARYVLKERLNVKQKAALALIVVGIFAIKL